MSVFDQTLGGYTEYMPYRKIWWADDKILLCTPDDGTIESKVYCGRKKLGKASLLDKYLKWQSDSRPADE